MEWLPYVGRLIKSIPIERVLFPPRNPAKELEKLATEIKPTETQKPPPPAVEVAPGASDEIVTRPGLHPETMRWQLQEARAELWELEGHLKHYCKECGPDFSCCFKHSQNVIDIARETKSMTTDPLWDAVITLAEEVRSKAHPDHIRAETYFREFPELVVRVGTYRKSIETLLIELSKPELSLEEAKKLAAEEAAKEVEKRWHSQEKK